MKNASFLILASLFFITNQVSAQSSSFELNDESSSTMSQNKIHFGKLQQGDRNNPEGLWPFLGFGLGFTGATDTNRTGGLPMNIKAMGSYYFPENPWVAEAGLGFFNQVYTQNGGGSDMMQAFYLEAAGRYRLEDKWQVGGVLYTLVDTSNRFNSGNHDLTTFVGPQLLKEFNYGDYLVRAGGRVAIDIGIVGEFVPMAMFDLQMTWGDNPGEIVDNTPSREPARYTEEIREEIITETVSYSAPSRPVTYTSETTRNYIVPSNKAFMQRLSRNLANNKDLYQKVEVIEHKNKSGVLNVTAELKKAGVENTQVATTGSSYNKALMSSDDYDGISNGSRVELKFIGVYDEKLLSQLIKSTENF